MLYMRHLSPRICHAHCLPYSVIRAVQARVRAACSEVRCPDVEETSASLSDVVIHSLSILPQVVHVCLCLFLKRKAVQQPQNQLQVGCRRVHTHAHRGMAGVGRLAGG